MAEINIQTLFLEVKAPFAAFRWMQAGVYRATSPVVPPSAAWGLVLNLAGIDVRGVSKDGSTTLISQDAPALDVAVGMFSRPETGTLYQQLHSYPVGISGKEFKERSFGSKFWIAPIRREVLVGFHCVIGVRGPKNVLSRVGKGLRGELDVKRYGLPFAGDNNFLLDEVSLSNKAPKAIWFTPLQEDGGPVNESCRLTVSIDRKDSSRTKGALFAPLNTAGPLPQNAWVQVSPKAKDIAPVYGDA